MTTLVAAVAVTLPVVAFARQPVPGPAADGPTIAVAGRKSAFVGLRRRRRAHDRDVATALAERAETLQAELVANRTNPQGGARELPSARRAASLNA